MAFGKSGRPTEDRLARQQEIYGAVAPMILSNGVRQLSMQAAAQTAYMSIGGLYHYFPNKRALVLYALQPEVVIRCCQDFQAAYGHLLHEQPAQYLNAKLNFMVEQIDFRRPSVHAALELGSTTFWEVIEASFAAGLTEFNASFARCYPNIDEERRWQMSRSLRRAMVAALLDKQTTSEDLLEELQALIVGYLEIDMAHMVKPA